MVMSCVHMAFGFGRCPAINAYGCFVLFFAELREKVRYFMRIFIAKTHVQLSPKICF